MEWSHNGIESLFYSSVGLLFFHQLILSFLRILIKVVTWLEIVGIIVSQLVGRQSVISQSVSHSSVNCQPVSRQSVSHVVVSQFVISQ